MLSRRDALFGTLLYATTSWSCSSCSRSQSTGASGPAAPENPRRSTHAGVTTLEHFVNGADETSPLVVAIHGRGGAPEEWLGTLSGFPKTKKAEIVMPRAPTSFGDGWSWFEFREGMTDDEFGVEVGTAEERLWPALLDVAGPAARKMIVLGFSQGAFLSYAIASRHGDRVIKAFPISGSCPGPLLPKPGVKPAPIVAFHGTADDVVEIKWGRAAVRGFVERGGDAVLHEYPGIAHAMSREMRADLFAELEKALP